ncbi:MAG: hypothetical protein AAFU65_10065, partial [Pseudomonadota bacterium]
MSAVMPLPNLIVRSMTHDDLPRVLEIERASYGFPWSEGIFKDCLRVGYHCRVLIRGDELIGYGIVSALVREAHILNIRLARRDGQKMGQQLPPHAQLAVRHVKADVQDVRLAHQRGHDAVADQLV